MGKKSKSPWTFIFILLFIIILVIVFIKFIKFESFTNEYKRKYKNKNKLNVVYINLDNRKDRNEQMIQELEGFCKEYTRLSASYNEEGYLGCSESHIRSIQFAIEKNFKHVLIFEDDFTFVQNKEKVYDDIVDFIKKQKNEWDVLLLSFNQEKRIPFNDTFDRVNNSQTASAYVVHRNYYKRLLNHYLKGHELLLKTGDKNKYMNDMYWKLLQKTDNWFALKTAAGIQRKSYSDIESREVDYQV